MDDMDIDQVVEIPDTPDRVAARNINGRDIIRRGKYSSVSSRLGNSEVSDVGFKDQSTNKDKVVNDRGSQRLLFPPRKDEFISDGSENQRKNASTIAPVVPRNGLRLQRNVVDKSVNHEDKNFTHAQLTGKGKAISTSQSKMSACDGHGAVLDLSKQSGTFKVRPKIILKNSRSEECLGGISVDKFPISTSQSKMSACDGHGVVSDLSKQSGTIKVRPKIILKNSGSEECIGGISVNKFPVINLADNSPGVDSNACKVKQKQVDREDVRASLDRGKGIELAAESRPYSGRSVPSSLHLSTSHRTSGQKRLVRNGCISPHNVEKVKQSVPKNISSLASPEGYVRELIADDSDPLRVKGKGILLRDCLSKESDAKAMPLSSRSSNHSGKDKGTKDNEDVIRSSEGLGGWRSTRNRTSKSDAEFSDDPYKVNEPHMITSASPTAQTVSCFKHQGDQPNELQRAVNTLAKRQKQGSARGHQGESSSSSCNNSEVVILGSSGERSTRPRTNPNAGTLNPIIEIDEFTPEMRNTASHRGSSRNVDSDVKARQLEADELLARELQEQLYNEVSGNGIHETDEHIALALLQEETSRASSSESRHVPHPRLLRDIQRQTNLRSSQNPATRRVSRPRVPTSTRMQHLRGRFPGQPRTISSNQRDSLFPPNVDVDMRMHILEALEAFSDMGMAGGILQMQRDFNENDYEMLLALDENNHQHAGASAALINGLPQSTVQSDNLEECSICLETPSIGDTIRHLPCLHRFHKDCIDPWLGRRSSCPVCKSSIT